VKNVDTSGVPTQLPELAPDVKAALKSLALEYHQVDLNARKEEFQRQTKFLEPYFQGQAWWPKKLTLWLRIRRAIARLKARWLNTR
jgi:hypothetical protein